MSEEDPATTVAQPGAKAAGLEAEFRSSISDMGEIIHGLGLSEQVCKSSMPRSIIAFDVALLQH
jgi:hypothetical protein